MLRRHRARYVPDVTLATAAARRNPNQLAAAASRDEPNTNQDADGLHDWHGLAPHRAGNEPCCTSAIHAWPAAGWPIRCPCCLSRQDKRAVTRSARELSDRHIPVPTRAVHCAGSCVRMGMGSSATARGRPGRSADGRACQTAQLRRDPIAALRLFYGSQRACAKAHAARSLCMRFITGALRSCDVASLPQHVTAHLTTRPMEHPKTSCS